MQFSLPSTAAFGAPQKFSILRSRLSAVASRIWSVGSEIHFSSAAATVFASPTAGEHFIQDAAVGAEHLHQAVASLILAKRGQSGELRIGLMASLASGFVADRLGTYHQRFPAIELKLDETTSQLNASAALGGRLDAAFLPGHPELPSC